MNTLASLTKTLSKVQNDISINYLDRSQGVKTGTLIELSPSFKYTMKGGEAPKPFNIANIVLINRQKRNNEWVDVQLPCFAMNFKAKEQTDEHRTTYYTMLFRNTSSDELAKELIDADRNGTSLNKAKALYSIIKRNKLSPANFWETIESGEPITFAQYKRDNGQINFVDEQYYNEKIAQTQSSNTSDDDLPL